MTNLITLNNGAASVAEDTWTIVHLPASQAPERVLAGKVVLFKLTGEATVTPEQIAGTVIPATGKVILPLQVFFANLKPLSSRIAAGEIGVWLATHELIEDLNKALPDLNQLPLIAIFVERFADGRIFSLGNLLRTRFGFKNDLRAFGDVLKDQLFFLKRSGFSSFLIRADRSATDAITSLHEFTAPYQGAVDEPRPVFSRYNRAN